MLAVDVLELSFIALLGVMSVAIGLFAIGVVVRLVEPRGLKAFLRKTRRHPSGR